MAEGWAGCEGRTDGVPEPRSRPGWDEYFMQVARVVAGRSTCLRRQVGAVIVRDKRILATGYNGAPSGLPHCLDIGCLRHQVGALSGERQELCRASHAEQNALVQAARYGIAVEGATLYSTTFPCSICAKMLVNAGIRRVVYGEEYADLLAREILELAGTEVVRIEIPGLRDEEHSPAPAQ
ncbi:MAG: dCMP deaminase family protein [Bacillota bacterium]